MSEIKVEIGTARHTFAIPDGVKEITVSQVGNRIVVEMVPTAKAPKPLFDALKKAGKRWNPETMQVEEKCFSHIPEDENKVLTRIKEVYQLEDIDVDSRRWGQVEARAIWTYDLIKIGKIRHADAAKIVGRKRSMMYHYVKLVEDLYETNIPFRERFNRIGIPWRS